MGRERPLGVSLGRLKDKEAEAGKMRLLWRIGGLLPSLKRIKWKMKKVMQHLCIRFSINAPRMIMKQLLVSECFGWSKIIKTQTLSFVVKIPITIALRILLWPFYTF